MLSHLLGSRFFGHPENGLSTNRSAHQMDRSSELVVAEISHRLPNARPAGAGGKAV
jgi:hypothetical protein